MGITDGVAETHLLADVDPSRLATRPTGPHDADRSAARYHSIALRDSPPAVGEVKRPAEED